MRARAEVGEPEISILLLARDGAATLPALLDAVEAQRAARAFEVVAVDSGSTDGSLDLLRQRADRLLTVPSSEFNHGTTRNTGIAACRGRFIVLLVQDAVPASPDWLSLLVEPLLSDDSLAGTFARQWPRPGASALTRHYHAAALAARAEPRVLALDGEQEFAVLPPVERYQRCAFDNVCSCIRRSVWEAHPFAATPIAEDAEWARDVLLAGHRLRYVPEAAVVHSHERPARYELARAYLCHQRLRRLFGLRTVATPLHLVAAVGTATLSHLSCVRREPSWGRALRALPRALALAVAWPLGEYLGALSADTGWPLLRPRGLQRRRG